MATTAKILVNACGAKAGGARTILRQLVANIPCPGYVVACPDVQELQPLCSSAEFINVETHGLSSMKFTLFGAASLARAKRCSTIVSLMNFNVLTHQFHRITYFHQLKAIDGTGPKEWLQRILLKRTSGSGDLIICQTPYVLSRLRELRLLAGLESFWPGFEIGNHLAPSRPASAVRKDEGPLFLVPSSSMDGHKNIGSVLEKARYFSKIGARVVITGAKFVSDIEPIHLIPIIPRAELFELYAQADAVIFPSRLETVALPVFEFLSIGKPVFLHRSPYTQRLFDRFGKLANLHIYDQDPEALIDAWMASGRPNANPRPDLASGDWSWLPR